MKFLEWLRRTMQTSSWTHEQAGLWATRHFPEQQRVAAAVGEILVEQVGVTFESLTPGARFIEDLAMDDLEPVTVVMALEEEFGFSIPVADSEHLTTVSELVCYLQERVHANAS
jgi:acyl carrier protein